MTSLPAQAAAVIQEKFPDFKPRIGIVLGSGLGDFASHLKNSHVIHFEDLPGFPIPSVKGHAGQLILGELNGKQIACLKGRSHTYESQSLDYTPVKTSVRTLKLLGCEVFIATNASGSMHMDVGPGELVCVTDHINFQPSDPLVGPNDDEFGPRFLPLDNAYDLELRVLLHQAADEGNIKLHNGVYLSVLGPCYETAAEIRAFKILGADLVGMSTVPEVIVANHCGMRVVVVSTVTNLATGLSNESHDHNNVVAVAKQAEIKMSQLFQNFVGKLP